MFEHGPWQDCPACKGQRKLGILMVAANRARYRCTACLHVVTEMLPALDKTVIYLDQNAASELYKVDAGKRKAGAPHEDFWKELAERMETLLLLQQVIFPDSDLHSNETIVYREPEALRTAFRRLGGGVSFRDTFSIDLMQQAAFAKAYETTMKAPALDFGVDQILTGERNAWIPPVSIRTNPDLSRFADGLREERDKAHEALKEGIERWRNGKMTFDAVLKEELESYGSRHYRAWEVAAARQALAYLNGDAEALLGASLNPYLTQQIALSQRFQALGFSEAEALQLVFCFWNWPELRVQPVHRMQSYLFAAMARRVGAGQRTFSRGMVSDVNAISTYAPYVDAMFVDNECAALLREGPLRDDLDYKARIFSLDTKDEFLAYLDSLAKAVSKEVRSAGEKIYGVKAVRG